jgi:hypothetical protein
MDIDNIDLQGWECYGKTSTNKGYLHLLQKKENDKWLCMVSLEANIEHQIKHNLTDVNKYTNLDAYIMELKPIAIN